MPRMLPWKLLAKARVPGDNGELVLQQRGDEFSIRVDGYELMNTRVHGSEDALAEVACAKLKDTRSAHVLVGGLGVGFTLAAALRQVGPTGRVTVAELVPEVVEWNRGPMGAASGNPLADPRTVVRVEDVASVIRGAKNEFDAILLDVDNGPTSLVAKGNDRLYTVAGLRAAHAALKPNGVLAIWSSADDPAFTKRLNQNGFVAEIEKIGSSGRTRGPRYWVWTAVRE
jgi:spermidine synthase